jgi:signal transduction histidine kinase
MSLFSSLTNRIFVAFALLVLGAIGVAIYRLTVSVTAQAEADLRAGLADAATLVDELSKAEFADFVVKGRLVAVLPTLNAAATTEHRPTVQPVAEDYQAQVGFDLFVIAGPTGQILAQAGRLKPDDAGLSEIFAACRTAENGSAFWPYADGVLHAMAIPLVSGPSGFGTLLVGHGLDRSAALRLKTMTRSEVAFAYGSRVLASSLDAERTAALGPTIRESGVFTRSLAGEEYVGRVQALGAGSAHADPVAIVLRSRTEHLTFLPPLRWQIAMTGLAAVLAATLVGYLIARTVTRPLRALTAAMREIAATGDLTRPAPATGRWDDEDARLLAANFSQLTGALSRFQREAAQRERLSSLGRLSTVVAHEVRNPLMIIKGALRPLQRHPSPDVTAVATSIDEEVSRLNRVVTDVLDFAKPIRFDLAEADLTAICADAARAASTGPGNSPVALELDATPAPLVTDAERLRSVLVNLLSNAQQAVRALERRPAGPVIRLRVSRLADRGWRVEVIDRGSGIAADDLPRVFEPFFTTRRTGSGLGLAIARNVVEGLGGSIAVTSQPGEGTTVRIDLPAGGPVPPVQP